MHISVKMVWLAVLLPVFTSCKENITKDSHEVEPPAPTTPNVATGEQELAQADSSSGNLEAEPLQQELIGYDGSFLDRAMPGQPARKKSKVPRAGRKIGRGIQLPKRANSSVEPVSTAVLEENPVPNEDDYDKQGDENVSETVIASSASLQATGATNPTTLESIGRKALELLFSFNFTMVG